MLVNAPKFPQACGNLVRFLQKHDVEKILVYGSSDRNMLEATGKSNKMSPDELCFSKSITSIENIFRKTMDCGQFSWSLHDLRRIFHVENDQEHSALCDAQTLALCGWKLMQQEIDWPMAEAILKEKVWKSGYKQNRRVQGPVNNKRPLNLSQMNEIKSAIYASDVPDFVKDALFDDLLTICGSQPEHIERLRC